MEMLYIDGFVKILKEKGIEYKMRGNKYWRRIEITNNGEIVFAQGYGGFYFRAYSPRKIVIDSYLARGVDVCKEPMKVEDIKELHLELNGGYILVTENASVYNEYSYLVIDGECIRIL